MKHYNELLKINDFNGRFDYLKMKGIVADRTFGGHRYLNQMLYNCQEWKTVRRQIIIRDNGCDLGIQDRPIFGKIIVHHINPITIDDVLKRNPCVFDPENLICCSHNTHEAIHYGNESTLISDEVIIRKPNDTCLWR